MEELEKKSTVELVADLTILEQQIDMLVMKHEKIRTELIRRFPMIANDEEFQPKKLIKNI